MGVSVEQVLSEMAEKSAGDVFNKTVPTPLTNYLDVGPVHIPSGVREVTGASCFTLFLGFLLNRLSILGKSASALLPRCSTWCLTQAQQICGCPRKAALPFPPPVVSVPPSGTFCIQTFTQMQAWVCLDSRYQPVTAEINSSISEKLSHMGCCFICLRCITRWTIPAPLSRLIRHGSEICPSGFLIYKVRRLIWSQCETVEQQVSTEIL